MKKKGKKSHLHCASSAFTQLLPSRLERGGRVPNSSSGFGTVTPPQSRVSLERMELNVAKKSGTCDYPALPLSAGLASLPSVIPEQKTLENTPRGGCQTLLEHCWKSGALRWHPLCFQAIPTLLFPQRQLGSGGEGTG